MQKTLCQPEQNKTWNHGSWMREPAWCKARYRCWKHLCDGKEVMQDSEHEARLHPSSRPESGVSTIPSIVVQL